jgi:hypothetical protein
MQVALNESVVRASIGGSTVMADQLGRLADAANLPNVSLRVVPLAVAFHLGLLAGQFEILRFPANGDGRDSEPPTVYQEGFTGALYLDKQHEVGRYTEVFDNIWNAALDESASRHLIDQAAEELRQ